ncbi:MAG TPA: extracellular solute-binding protein [Nitrososphaeraceae archaeon]|nr:extracellular solute-binding protein [Nitrososphaeraceae archaeon]
MSCPKLLLLATGIILLLGLSLVAIYSSGAIVSGEQKKQVTLTAILDDQGDPPRLLKMLFQPAIQELEARHPDLDIQLDYRPVPYNNLHEQILNSMANQTPVDIVTVHYIWLGEFAEKGFLTDLTNYTKNWGRSSDWYEANWDGGIYNDKVYGIWTVVDVRGLWYWKDMLNEAAVDPNSLRTWDGYIQAAKKLNTILRPEGIEGVHLVGANHSPDIDFFPYLWMVGGDIIGQKSGHPTKGNYWFPTYNSSQGVRALEFIKAQIDAGVKPQKNHFWGIEFLDRKFAVMLEALQNHVHVNTTEQKQQFEQKVGFLPMFPVPNATDHSATLMGGWELGITNTSRNKELAWELVTLMVEPKIITPFYEKYGLLPTQISIGDGEYSANLSKSIPYYDELISMLQLRGVRPNIPEYPQIADHIRQALDEVLYGLKEPKQALDDAAVKSAKAMGW